jgi:ketosteroid isomerase-like protein
VSNVATVQQMYEAFGRGDVPAILDVMADDVEFDEWGVGNTGQDAGVPWLQHRSGRKGAADFFQAVGETLEFHGFEPLNILEGPGQVAAVIRFDATAKETGERFQDEEIHLWTFDGEGRVKGMRHVVDTAKHIKAAKGSLTGVT